MKLYPNYFYGTTIIDQIITAVYGSGTRMIKTIFALRYFLFLCCEALLLAYYSRSTREVIKIVMESFMQLFKEYQNKK